MKSEKSIKLCLALLALAIIVAPGRLMAKTSGLSVLTTSGQRVEISRDEAIQALQKSNADIPLKFHYSILKSDATDGSVLLGNLSVTVNGVQYGLGEILAGSGTNEWAATAICRQAGFSSSLNYTKSKNAFKRFESEHSNFVVDVSRLATIDAGGNVVEVTSWGKYPVDTILCR